MASAPTMFEGRRVEGCLCPNPTLLQKEPQKAATEVGVRQVRAAFPAALDLGYRQYCHPPVPKSSSVWLALC
jgi:hypothetical protein